MRVALFLEAYLTFINGVRTHVGSLAAGLKKLGHDVLVVCADPSVKKHVIKDGVLCCPSISLKKIYNYGAAGPISYKRFKYIKDFRPDIIHVHTEFGIGISGVFAAKLLKIPYVYTIHTLYDEYIYYISPKKLTNITKKAIHVYARVLTKNATCITGPSIKVESFLRDCGVKKEVYIIPNPVELSLFDERKVSLEEKQALRKKLPLKQDDILACFCGRLAREKSVDVLIKNWKVLIEKKQNYKLLIFGDGPFKNELKNLAKELGVLDNVLFLGSIPHKELPPYYCLCDFYVTASLSDTNSISALEAMAAGLPVFHIYDEPNKNQIIEGVNGFMYKDAFDMRDLIFKFENMSFEEKNKLKKTSRESVLCFGEEDLAKRLLDIYKKALDIYKEKRLSQHRHIKVSH